jgi:hypothetical protein
MSEPTGPTQEQVTKHIAAMRDSVTVINQEVARTEPLTEGQRGNIDRNVRHLELMMAKQFIIDRVTGGEDLSDITTAITSGNAKLSA